MTFNSEGATKWYFTYKLINDTLKKMENLNHSQVNMVIPASIVAYPFIKMVIRDGLWTYKHTGYYRDGEKLSKKKAKQKEEIIILVRKMDYGLNGMIMDRSQVNSITRMVNRWIMD